MRLGSDEKNCEGYSQSIVLMNHFIAVVLQTSTNA